MITLTDKASVKVKELIDAEGVDDLALRVAVRPGGCSGFSYEMFFDSEIAEGIDQENDWPQPQVRWALGLLIVNPAPWRPSL